MNRIVLFVFAGRRENMEIQRRYTNQLLDLHPGLEIHYWNMARNDADRRFVNSLADDRHKIIDGGRRRRGQYEEPWRYYAADESYSDAVFVKMDDDVLWFEVEHFGDFVALLADSDRPVSALVTNNVVCAKHDPDLGPQLRDRFSIGPIDDPGACEDWWFHHTNPLFALESHEWLLDNIDRLPRYDRVESSLCADLNQREKVSINLVGMSHRVLRMVAALTNGSAFARRMRDEFPPRTIIATRGFGDEGAVDALLPYIYLGLRAAHLSFGPQERALGERLLGEIRARYAAL